MRLLLGGGFRPAAAQGTQPRRPRLWPRRSQGRAPRRVAQQEVRQCESAASAALQGGAVRCQRAAHLHRRARALGGAHRRRLGRPLAAPFAHSRCRAVQRRVGARRGGVPRAGRASERRWRPSGCGSRRRPGRGVRARPPRPQRCGGGPTAAPARGPLAASLRGGPLGGALRRAQPSAGQRQRGQSAEEGRQERAADAGRAARRRHGGCDLLAKPRGTPRRRRDRCGDRPAASAALLEVRGERSGAALGLGCQPLPLQHLPEEVTPEEMAASGRGGPVHVPPEAHRGSP
mmetsp:Transcript_18453/g.44073  ORF Transcript_18453/g.44073 Transcript_18453/m.44073 type:complete len:289 (+) Transcript_18453:798-1664(+)